MRWLSAVSQNGRSLARLASQNTGLKHGGPCAGFDLGTSRLPAAAFSADTNSSGAAFSSASTLEA